MPSVDQVTYIQVEYSVPIIALSVFIACLASYTSLSMNERIVYHSFFHRYIWLGLAAITMSLGIWSMHFIGMSAAKLPIEMTFNIPLTILSLVPAILATFLAFSISSKAKNSSKWIAFAGIFMGIGISSMHYIGMKAMKSEADYDYHLGYFILSIFIAIIASFFSLFIFMKLQKYMNNFIVKIVTSLLMGGAISSMHYTGMYAIRYYVDTEMELTHTHSHHVSIIAIIIGVTIGIFVILLFSILSSLLDRYVDYRLNYFDSLTKLPNRRQFERLIESSTYFSGLAILHIHDLNKWNGKYGYYFGDKIIGYIEELCTKLIQTNVELFRIEGNRFAIVSTTNESLDKLMVELNQLTAILSNPVTIDDRIIKVETAIALSVNEKKASSKLLYENAVAVLTHYSIRFDNEIILYDPEKHKQTFANHLVNEIEDALLEKHLYLVYQPKVFLKSTEVAGLEALLRWKHPLYGELSPGVFIPILEASDKMYDVTDWIIEEVSKQIDVWQQQDRYIPVAINIPGSYVTSPRLMTSLTTNVEKYKLIPHLIELEITETSAVGNIEGAIQSVQAFRNVGFTVTLDDFGTGVSSLSYLKRIPVNTLKIDKSFIDGVPESQKDGEIIKAIIALGSSLHLSIVIEGVEREEQINYLSSINEWPIIQGYYYAKPMTVFALEEWLFHFQKGETAIQQ
ncbi:EAL domain-containing protein [Niallia circulans]|uniref:bifunctional diguanylate cyclase/phosphodiesterase n=1 Tax=Niallia circulans TaxID=1397 RepID=UPI001F3757D5|nr:EAL domain-containing protein [Niallia circulans]MCF2647388.1 EAL domain-containing protein [Niallia circulans]